MSQQSGLNQMYLRCDTLSSNLENLDLDSIAPKHLIVVVLLLCYTPIECTVSALRTVDYVQIRIHSWPCNHAARLLIKLSHLSTCSKDPIPCLSKSVLLC